MTLLLDGKGLAQTIRAELRTEVDALKAHGVTPKLCVALVGEFGPSVIYVRNKEKACADIGVECLVARLPATTTMAELLDSVRNWNADPLVHGMIVQLPLPGQLDPKSVIEVIDPTKDVDGLSPVNLGRILAGDPCFCPATPSGILEILRRNGIIVEGRHVVVVGRGELVGKPLANMLLRKCEIGNATVTVCHTRTPDLGLFTRQADILVAAAGKAGLIRGEMVQPGAVVVDAGINRIETESGAKLVGDVEFAEVMPIASAITPVPGGIGPMTIAMLLKNTVMAAQRTERS